MPAALLANNRAWSAARLHDDPEYFHRLAAQQRPRFLWIGCSDSRVPANEIVGLAPGEVFVHRNVANLVVHSDLNCLSVLEFAVFELRVEHVIVCGHYGCGGVAVAYEGRGHALSDNWLRTLKGLGHRHAAELAALPTRERRLRRLCELNVADQAENVCQTTVIQRAWATDHDVTVHGWIYDLADGLIRPLTPERRGR